MRDNPIRQVMEEIHMPSEKKSEIWDAIEKKADEGKKKRMRAAAAAVILVLLLVPAGVYAGGRFDLFWKNLGEKNGQLDHSFRREDGVLEEEGFRFCIEQALCDEGMGFAYYYMSVTDISGENRNPADFMSTSPAEGERGRKIGDIVFDIHNNGAVVYDEKNSTDTKMYLFMETEMQRADEAAEAGSVEIQFYKIADTGDGSYFATSKGIVVEERSIPIRNVVHMPTLSWKIEKGGETVEVRVSTVIARVINEWTPELEIEMKDGRVIRDYFDFNQDVVAANGAIPDDNCFTSKCGYPDDQTMGKEVIYRMDYINIDEISGIRLDGEFYPVCS